MLRLIQHLYMLKVVILLPSKELSQGSPAAPAANTTDFMWTMNCNVYYEPYKWSNCFVGD